MSSLEEYQKKRKFTETDEPTGTEKQKKPSNRPIFVVQKHNAVRAKLHYDFRIEVAGVLKSFVIRKEPPPLIPKEKKFAIQTEDHPLEYAEFEGIIPTGEYGAGTVEIWDKGTYQNITQEKGVSVPLTEAAKNGHISMYLEGDKLQGEYSLILTRVVGKMKNWFLIKKQVNEKSNK
jgi:bifunctional non-homologous end joining protein LigD